MIRLQKGTNGFLRPKKIIMKNLQQRTMRLLAIIIILGFGTTIFGMGYSQLYKGDFFKTKAETQQLSDTAITAQRGIIYDANMSVLAQSASAWKISLNATAFAEIPAKAQEQVYSVLINTLGVTREYLENKASYKQYNSVSIKTKVEKEAKDKLEAFVKGTFIDKNNNEQSFGSVVMIDEDVKRYYPYSTLASQILGFTGTDNNGLSGLESYYNSTLTGVDGRVISARSNSSVAQDIEYKSVYEAKQGTSLVLTVDETIQRYLENALSSCYETSKANSCTGIVMDVKTGAILAMSTKGDFDPNDPYTINDKRTIESINKITDTKEKAEEEAMYSQWRNRAISDTYEPGSVFKLITMAAGLEENVVKYDEKFTCTGSVNVADRIYSCHNTAGHGTQTLTEGLMNSCNPYFITIGQRLGVDTFYKYFEAFGFTEETGIDLPGEASPKAGVTYFKKDTMTKVNLASSSFGQSFQITPIQMITAVNAIANDGKLMQPYIVSKTLDSDGNVILQNQPIEKRQVVSESTSEKIMASMEQVALNGTARNAYVAGYRVGGKTGTSDKLNNVGQVVASFVGVAPTNDPRITVLIVVDEPEGATGGGAVAAPVAGEVIENTLTYLNVERQYNDSEKALLDVQVPSVTGDSVSEAKSSLEEDKFSVQIVGEGDKVLSQMPASGQYIPQGGVIVLYTEKQKKKMKTVVPDFTGMTITEANYAAVNAGINIKVSGNSLSEESMTAYRQSSLKGSEVESGSTVTVYFRTTSGVSDH